MKTCLFVFTILCAFICIAQSTYGLKGGVNFSSLGSDSDFRPGLNFGVYGVRPINKNVSLRPELFFARQGANFDNVKANYSCINLPILLQMKITSGLFYLGPQARLLLKATSKENREKTDITARLNNVNFSGVIGFLFKANDHFSYDVRFSHSLNSTQQDAIDRSFVPNVVLSLSLNYAIK